MIVRRRILVIILIIVSICVCWRFCGRRLLILRIVMFMRIMNVFVRKLCSWRIV